MTHNSNMQQANKNINGNQRNRYYTKKDRQSFGYGAHQQYPDPHKGNYLEFGPVIHTIDTLNTVLFQNPRQNI